jgi:hypothetical protein
MYKIKLKRNIGVFLGYVLNKDEEVESLVKRFPKIVKARKCQNDNDIIELSKKNATIEIVKIENKPIKTIKQEEKPVEKKIVKIEEVKDHDMVKTIKEAKNDVEKRVIRKAK